MLTCEIIHTEAGLADLQKDWKRLYAKQKNATVFQMYEWNRIVWKYTKSPGDDLFILKFTDEESGITRAIVPFCVSHSKVFKIPIRILRFMGERFGSFLNYVSDFSEDEFIPVMIKEILSNKKYYDVAAFKKLGWNPQNLQNLKQQFETSSIHIDEDALACYLDLKEKSDVYECVNPGFAKYLKRKVKKINKDFDCQFIKVADLPDFEKYFPVFVRLNKLRSREKLQLGVFRSPAIEKMFYELMKFLLEQELLLMNVILLDQEPVSVLFNMKDQQSCFFYQSGLDPQFNKYSTGHVVHYYAIEDALKTGLNEYNFLDGNESYKFQWTQTFRQYYALTVVNSKFKYKLYQFYLNLYKLLVNNDFLKSVYFRLN